MTETYLSYLLCFDAVRHTSLHPVTSVARATLSASYIKRMFKNTTAVCFVSLCCIKTTYLLHSAYVWGTVLRVLSIHLHFPLVFCQTCKFAAVFFLSLFLPFFSLISSSHFSEIMFYKTWFISMIKPVL
jgi:hypothetical protein